VFDHARLELARLHVAPGSDLRDTFRCFAELVATTLNVERVGVWLLEDGRALRCHFLYQPSRHEMYEGTVLHAQDFPAYFQALNLSRVIPVHDAHADPRTQDFRDAYLGPLGITSMLDAPIFRGGLVAGVVCHEHIGPPRIWDAAECDFTCAAAEALARLFEEAARLEAESSLGVYQAHALEMDRMEALGRLAAGVAHDFGNVLQVVLVQSELALRSGGHAPEVVAAIQPIVQAAEQGMKLTRELLAFGRKVPDAPRVLDLQQILDSLVGILQVALGRGNTLRLDCPKPVSRVFIDQAHLERALFNLVLNARDAMPHGGQVVIEVEERQVNRGKRAGGTYVAVTVRDSGVGMDAATRERIFEPFFTTKGEKGTGLGLPIAYQVIGRAGGFFEVESEPGHGAAVRFYLPRIAATN
jgi:signal transduction histidine kinase